MTMVLGHKPIFLHVVGDLRTPQQEIASTIEIADAKTFQNIMHPRKLNLTKRKRMEKNKNNNGTKNEDRRNLRRKPRKKSLGGQERSYTTNVISLQIALSIVYILSNN